MVDAGEKAHALASLIQQCSGDFGARPVAGLAVVRRGGAKPLLAGRVATAGGEYLQTGEARRRRLRAGVVDAEEKVEIERRTGFCLATHQPPSVYRHLGKPVQPQNADLSFLFSRRTSFVPQLGHDGVR